MDEKDAIELLNKTSINYLFLDGILIKKIYIKYIDYYFWLNFDSLYKFKEINK